MRRIGPCRSCLYGSGDGYCTYILWTLHRRPCPPGKDCTVYERASDEQRKKAKNNIVIIPAATPKPPKPSRRTWDTAKALQMYQDGASDVQIAKACRVSPTTIYLWRNAQGLPTHAKLQQRTRTWDTAKALQMYQDDASDVQIAKALGVSPNTIGEWRKGQGLPLRHLKNEKKLVGTIAERALQMYQEGATDAQIARACGVSASGVCRWRKREGMSRLDRRNTKGGAR